MLPSISLLLALTAGAAAAQPAPAGGTAAPVRPVAPEAARVNGVPISADRLVMAMNALIPMESFHNAVPADKMAEVRQNALNGLVDEELQYQDGVRRGITVTTAEVDRRMAELRRQYGGRQNLERAEQRSGITAAQFRREVRRALTIEKTYARTVTAKCQVKRLAAELYFRDNPDQFVQPEQLHIFAITIGVDPSSPSSTWAEAKAQAEDVLERLRNGESFEDLAREYSTDPSKTSGGDMGYMHRGTLNSDFEAATTDLPLGEPSEVVRTIYGFHIVRVADIRPPQHKTFTEVGAQLQKDLTSRRCTELGDAWTARLRASAAIDITGSSLSAEAQADGRTP